MHAFSHKVRRRSIAPHLEQPSFVGARAKLRPSDLPPIVLPIMTRAPITSGLRLHLEATAHVTHMYVSCSVLLVGLYGKYKTAF